MLAPGCDFDAASGGAARLRRFRLTADACHGMNRPDPSRAGQDDEDRGRSNPQLARSFTSDRAADHHQHMAHRVA